MATSETGHGLLAVAKIARHEGIAHAFETRAGNLSARLPGPTLRLRQVHGAEVVVIDTSTQLGPFQGPHLETHPAADALVTARRGITVAVATADCVPVLVADLRRRVVGAAHAGWRGLASGVIPATLLTMGREFGSEPDDCVAAIGPCIGAQTYRVGEQVIEAFAAADIDADVFTPDVAQPGTPKTALCDLTAAARQLLLAAGLANENIHALELCTYSDKRFHSYRRDGEAAGRMLSGIALLP